MANDEKPRSPPPGPPHPECLRDPDYVVRGYQAALFNQNTPRDQRTDPTRDSWLTAWLEDISDEDRQRARVGLDGQPYDAAAMRMANEAREEESRRKSREENDMEG